MIFAASLSNSIITKLLLEIELFFPIIIIKLINNVYNLLIIFVRFWFSSNSELIRLNATFFEEIIVTLIVDLLPIKSHKTMTENDPDKGRGEGDGSPAIDKHSEWIISMIVIIVLCHQ